MRPTVAPQKHPDAKAGEALRNMRGNHRRDGARQQPFLRLDNGHAPTARRKCRGDFQPDEAAADDRDVIDPAGKFADGAGVGDGAQRQYAGERAAFDGQQPRARAGRKDRLVEGEAAARGQLQPLRPGVQTFDAFAEQKVDRPAGIKGFGAQDLRLGGGILDEGLRQRRLVVGQFGLVADQRDDAVISFLAQARGSLYASVTRSDDDDASVHDASCACLPPLRPR